MLKNAKLRSVEEFIKGMLDGELFYIRYKGYEYKYYYNSITNQFLIEKGEGGLISHCVSFSRYEDVMIKYDSWRDNIPVEGILCTYQIDGSWYYNRIMGYNVEGDFYTTANEIIYPDSGIDIKPVEMNEIWNPDEQ